MELGMMSTERTLRSSMRCIDSFVGLLLILEASRT